MLSTELREALGTELETLIEQHQEAHPVRRFFVLQNGTKKLSPMTKKQQKLVHLVSESCSALRKRLKRMHNRLNRGFETLEYVTDYVSLILKHTGITIQPAHTDHRSPFLTNVLYNLGPGKSPIRLFFADGLELEQLSAEHLTKFVDLTLKVGEAVFFRAGCGVHSGLQDEFEESVLVFATVSHSYRNYDPDSFGLVYSGTAVRNIDCCLFTDLAF